LLTVKDGKTECDAYALGTGGSTMVYITNPARRQELAAKLAETFRNTEGVGEVLLPAGFAKWDMPDPAKNSRMSDLVLVAKDGYAFHGSLDGPDIGGPETGYPGHHGYAASDPDMNTMFLAWGYGIRAGATLDRMSMLDVAPTLAALLGLELKNVEGRVLQEILVADQLKKR
jgi:predicted AlkP superfamily pyrophosphatase or phosphodiesterase